MIVGGVVLGVLFLVLGLSLHRLEKKQKELDRQAAEVERRIERLRWERRREEGL